MSDLTAFRDHCRKMAAADHKPECLGGFTDRWGWDRSVHPNPDCGGCNPAADRDLFARLAGEVDEYLTRPPLAEDLFGEVTAEPERTEEPA